MMTPRPLDLVITSGRVALVHTQHRVVLMRGQGYEGTLVVMVGIWRKGAGHRAKWRVFEVDLESI